VNRDRLRALWCIATVLLGCNDGAPPATTKAPVDERSPCAALCEHLAACGPDADFPGVAACTKTCEDDPHQQSGPCQEPRLAYERCVVALSCEQVRARNDLEVAKTGPCGAETRAVIACEPEAPPEPFIYFQF
jgi:hypothetical protein